MPSLVVSKLVKIKKQKISLIILYIFFLFSSITFSSVISSEYVNSKNFNKSILPNIQNVPTAVTNSLKSSVPELSISISSKMESPNILCFSPTNL